ncbi:tetratricopeptide repeat protein [Aeromicrobium sp. CF4.19]|uniref:tetratricopeptide repeat protein n=1 Tax=Aeromicrobium sp. CF4.19 TaxID=3373082 RepID=UPI003EE582C3
MSEDNRPSRSSGGRGGQERRPSGSRGQRPQGRDGRPAGGRGDDRRGRPAPRRGDDRRSRREEPERTTDQKIYDGPPIPDDVSAKDLDKFARQQLQNLPEKLAERAARHLVMAGLLVQSDPETAYLHTLAAKARASRNGMIREACGETAYAAGKFAEALAELRAARRMNGQQLYAAMMADCERALGRPEKALAFDTPEVRSHLDDPGQVELTIVVAGARRDLGQAEAALRLLETESLHSKTRADWVARLRYAYADTLLELGRSEEAVEWFHRVVAVDGNRDTDAEERLAQLE